MCRHVEITIKSLMLSACFFFLTYVVWFSPSWYNDWIGVCAGLIIGWLVPDIYYYVKYNIFESY